MTSPLNTNSISGAVCIVTGGHSGIGYEISHQLGAHSAAVVCVLGRRLEFLKRACDSLNAQSDNKGCRYIFQQCDVRSYDTCNKAVDHVESNFGPVSVLVNAAAGNFLSPAHQLSSKGFKTVIEIDLLGTFNMSRACFKSMRAAKRSTIVNISATLHLPATFWQVHASAAKAGIDSLTRSMALEWGKFGIRVNSIAPGPIEDTTGMAKLAPTGAMEENDLDKMVQEHIPVGRMGKKIDIAYMTVFLAGVAGEFISGANLVVDGGNMLYRRPMVPDDVVKAVSAKIEKKSRL